jgi:hypothetical protein
MNTPGIAGLGAGVKQILKEGQSKIFHMKKDWESFSLRHFPT